MPNKIQDLFGDWIQFDCPTDGVHYAIAVANRVWDPISLMWVSETQPGGGGGGGPATIADGADVAEGATTDAAIITDTTGTVSGKLRGLVKIFASMWDSVNGRLRVDGSEVTQPVSGTVSVSNFPASQPVSGSVSVSNFPVTQPVSGSVSVSNFPATQPVSGSVSVTGTVTVTDVATEATLAKIPGLAIPIFDYCALAQNATQDIWTFKTGGAGGTLVATVTITYTDATKVTISTVAKT
jgi:hypothetical protein